MGLSANVQRPFSPPRNRKAGGWGSLAAQASCFRVGQCQLLPQRRGENMVWVVERAGDVEDVVRGLVYLEQRDYFGSHRDEGDS